MVYCWVYGCVSRMGGLHLVKSLLGNDSLSPKSTELIGFGTSLWSPPFRQKLLTSFPDFPLLFRSETSGKKSTPPSNHHWIILLQKMRPPVLDLTGCSCGSLVSRWWSNTSPEAEQQKIQEEPMKTWTGNGGKVEGKIYWNSYPPFNDMFFFCFVFVRSWVYQTKKQISGWLVEFLVDLQVSWLGLGGRTQQKFSPQWLGHWDSQTADRWNDETFLWLLS